MGAGDIVRIETSGGGGYGDPVMRDPEAVLRDIKDETLTLEQAERRFGVITTTKGDIDPEATARRREELMAFRVVLTIETVDDDTFDGAKRLFGISKETAERLGVRNGDMIETTTGVGANVRGWACVSDSSGEGDILLGISTLSLMQASVGDRAQVRPVVRTPDA